MTQINDVTGISQDFKKVERDKNLKQLRDSKESRTAKVSNEDTKTNKVIKDIVNISSSGKSLLKQESETTRYLEELKNIKTLDRDELIRIHQRIKSNFYSRQEVLAKIVEDIVSQGPADTKETYKSKEKLDQSSEIRSRIKNGFYDSEEVLDVIAEKLLNPDKL